MFSNFLQEAKDNKIQINALEVYKDNHSLFSYPDNKKEAYNVQSIAKSHVSIAIGIAIDKGLLSLEDKPCEFFPELLPKNIDKKWFDVKLSHLLTMSLGHDREYLRGPEREYLMGKTSEVPNPKFANEWLCFGFDKPLTYNPGEKFVYSNLSTYIAGRMLEKKSQLNVLDFLYEYYWKPLNITKPRWDTDGNGHTVCATGLYLNIEELSMFGDLLLNKGIINGIRIVSQSYIEDATSGHIPCSSINPCGPSKDEKTMYGYYFWKNSIEGYRAYGKLGQFVIVFPKKKSVVAIQSDYKDAQGIMDLMWKDIYKFI